MPTIWREDGFEIRVNPNDHEPAHVHVFKSGGELKVQIQGDVSPLINWGMKDKDAAKACILVNKCRKQLLKAWEDIHG
ncbi:DUF4160 domain-containing protein [Phormidium tenue]|uniref:DUF4160 domain-containing protein n=1 Tax=Phormidium tenue NIES-30 TaxID=549789 RepID=A0A1U7IYD3_9CYAN|nr:DUF4160 domain-containing protein [Phormidium tenue FACHB-1052]OKH43473.1 hypothetical protein NIES30_25010 [Phormidium tenue NIES-30]